MKKGLKQTLLWRLSGALLIILVLLGLAYVSITTYSLSKYHQETTQRLNAGVAQSMLLEVQPFVDGEVNEEAVGKIMHSMMAVNPSIEVYLLNTQGEVLKYVVLDKKVRLKSVDINPVKEFIDAGGEGYILGDDPRTPGAQTIFSASEVRNEAGQLEGYVYMVLASEQYESVAGALSGSYFMKLGTQTFIITLIAAFGLGILLIVLLTRNLRRVVVAVKEFEKGNYHARIPVKQDGELADLANTFNHMADTILKNIEELKEVDALRRELIANVSHDLRSPLSVIHGYIETLMIKNDTLSDEERVQYLQIVLKSSERLNKLVADLFELSKLEADQVKVQYEKFNIHDLLDDTARQYQLAAKSRKVTLKSNFSGESMVNADLALMHRAIQNLVDNALKYTPENGEVEISAKANNGNVEVWVSNSGDGIPKEQLEHIFDRYYMLPKDKSKSEGSGLGLAIVKKIMDIHQFGIKVQSVKGGRTTFSFALPAA